MPGLFILTFFIALLGVVFATHALTRRRRHVSQCAGDRRMSEGHFAPVEAELDREAVPEEIGDEITARYGAIDRWVDDGAPAGAREPL